MNILNAEQICRVVREAQPNNARFHAMVDDLVNEYRGKTLGFGVTIVVCSFCGNEQRTVHPVPIQFPMECGECHRMTCFERVE